MPPIWRGNKKAFKGRAYAWQQGVGVSTTERWEGALSEMLPKAQGYYDQRWNVNLRPNEGTPIWTVEASVQGDPNNPNPSAPENIVNVHELLGNVLNPDNLTSPYLLSQFGYKSYATDEQVGNKIAYVRTRYKAILDGTREYQEVIDEDFALLPDGGLTGIGPWHYPSEVTLAKQVLRELLQGVNHYYQFQFVYRHTYNFGPLAAMRAGISNVGAVYFPDDLIAIEGIPSIEADDIREMGGEWLKAFPQKRVELGQRRTVTREYWWARYWTTSNYPTAIL